MRRLDDDMIDPEIEAQLDAIDATLAGEAVDPSHAELAELALLLAAERPEIDAESAASLDERVQQRFAATPARGSSRPSRLAFTWKAGFASLAAGVAAVVVVVVVVAVGSGGGSGNPVLLREPASTTASSSSAAGASSSASGSAASTARGSAVPGSVVPGSAAAPGVSSGGEPAATPQPPSNGRKIVQGAQLALSTTPNRVEDVAQQTFDVIGREHGIVRGSSVTATGGTDGGAEFELSVPGSALADTMTALSRLHYAHVASRTDTSQDVNNQYVSLTRRLADARALRTGLLRQLAGALTRQQIDSLRTRIRDAEASIAGLEADLRSLNRAVNLSQIALTISAVPAPAAHGNGNGSGFTIGKAAHDAGQVLTVAAGVALIALAGLVPLALLGALGLWILVALRRRRREQALDVA